MSASNFKTENNTFRKLIGNGLTYRIPPFQRDYSWTDSEWEDLWTDIVGTVQEGGEPAHYMGYLVLQSQDEKAFDVIEEGRRKEKKKEEKKIKKGKKRKKKARSHYSILSQVY